jgi:hypothetical protein
VAAVFLSRDIRVHLFPDNVHTPAVVRLTCLIDSVAFWNQILQGGMRYHDYSVAQSKAR